MTSTFKFIFIFFFSSLSPSGATRTGKRPYMYYIYFSLRLRITSNFFCLITFFPCLSPLSPHSLSVSKCVPLYIVVKHLFLMPPVFGRLTLGFRPPGSSAYRPHDIVHDRWYLLPLIQSRYVRPFKSCEQKVILGSKCTVHFFICLKTRCPWSRPDTSMRSKVTSKRSLPSQRSEAFCHLEFFPDLTPFLRTQKLIK